MTFFKNIKPVLVLRVFVSLQAEAQRGEQVEISGYLYGELWGNVPQVNTGLGVGCDLNR